MPRIHALGLTALLLLAGLAHAQDAGLEDERLAARAWSRGRGSNPRPMTELRARAD